MRFILLSGNGRAPHETRRPGNGLHHLTRLAPPQPRRESPASLALVPGVRQ